MGIKKLIKMGLLGFFGLMILIVIIAPDSGPKTTSNPVQTEVSTAPKFQLPSQCLKLLASNIDSDSETIRFQFFNDCGTGIKITKLRWIIEGANFRSGEKLWDTNSLAEDIYIKTNESKFVNVGTYRDNIYDVYTTVNIDSISYEPSSP
ncbi:MAG: hypothetical protein V3V92_05795 [Candidatus Hydrothermarchaeales archaeon]